MDDDFEPEPSSFLEISDSEDPPESAEFDWDLNFVDPNSNEFEVVPPSPTYDPIVDDPSYDPSIAPLQGETSDRVFASSSEPRAPAELEPDSQIYSRVLSASLIGNVDGGTPKLPWESGVMTSIFPSEDVHNMFPSFPQVDVTTVPAPVDRASVRSQPQDRRRVFDKAFIPGISSSVSLTRREVDFHQQRARLLAKALMKWTTLLQDMGDNSSLFNQIVDEGSGVYDFEVARTAVAAAFGVKSPGTLNKRADSMIHYSSWHRRCFANHVYPLAESDVWMYVCSLDKEKVGRTRAASFMQALNFCKFVIDLEGVDRVMSAQVKGRASQLYAQKREWRPAPLLSVQEVRLIHTFMDDETNTDFERFFAAHVLLAIYSRSRWSDFRSVKQIIFDWGRDDRGFIEVLTVHHKGTRTSELKTRLLPVVAPTQGVVEGIWARTLFSLRAKVGLPVDGEVNGALLPIPSPRRDVWHKAPVSSQEVSLFVQSVLKRDSGMQQPTSHSFKSTPLSWCSKYGLEEPDRKILGRHADKVHGADALYARDILARPLRRFKTVLFEIKTGNFNPDETRSGMFDESRVDAKNVAPAERACEPVPTDKPSHDVATEVQEVERLDGSSVVPSNALEVANMQSSSPSSSDSSSSDSCESQTSEEQEVFHAVVAEERSSDEVRMQHSTSGVIHAIRVRHDRGESRKFDCGRRPTHKHVVLRGRSPKGARKCLGCFPDAPRLRTVDQVSDLLEARAKARGGKAQKTE